MGIKCVTRAINKVTIGNYTLFLLITAIKVLITFLKDLLSPMSLQVLLKPKTLVLSVVTQRTQYLVIKEYTLNHNFKALINLRHIA